VTQCSKNYLANFDVKDLNEQQTQPNLLSSSQNVNESHRSCKVMRSQQKSASFVNTSREHHFQQKMRLKMLDLPATSNYEVKQSLTSPRSMNATFPVESDVVPGQLSFVKQHKPGDMKICSRMVKMINPIP
jgi:hypothetical protein